MITTLFALLTSGAGGGIIGGALGIFKQWQERKERVAMASIDMQRDKMEYDNAASEREHAIVMLSKEGEIAIRKIESETEAEIEVAHQDALSNAQDAIKNLNTTSGVDNFRGSIRPLLAIWFTLLFNFLLIWAFWKFSDKITPAEGKEILMTLLATLNFTVSSIVTFYYVARRNAAPKS